MKHYLYNRDTSLRFELPNGYGKHKKKVVITVYNCEPVVEVYLDVNVFMLIDLGSIYLLESNAFTAHKRNDGQLCGRANGSSREYAHRMILNPPPHLQVDHINHNPLDNRVRNLRECSAKQNNIAKKDSRINELVPSTGFIGVVHVNELRDEPAIYKVRHPCGGVYSKRFKCEWKAAEFRDEVISTHFLGGYDDGEWPTLNFIKWNFDTSGNRLIEESKLNYEYYMNDRCQSAYEKGIDWLKNTGLVKDFYDAYMSKYLGDEELYERVR